MLMLLIVQVFYRQLEKMTYCPEQTNAFLRDRQQESSYMINVLKRNLEKELEAVLQTTCRWHRHLFLVHI